MIMGDFMKLSDNFTELTKNDMEEVGGGFILGLIIDNCPLFRIFRPRQPEPGKPEDYMQTESSSLVGRIFSLFAR